MNAQTISDLLEHASQLKFKDHNAAREVLTRALEAAQALNHTALFIEASCELAWCDINSGEISAGIETALKALTLAREYDLTAMEGRAMGIIGFAFGISGNIYDSLQVFERQKDIATAVLDYKQLAGVLSDIGAIHDRFGNYQLSLELFLEAQKIVEAHPVGIVREYVLLNIAQTYHNLKLPQQAIEFYRDLMEIIEGREYYLIESMAHYGLGEVLVTLNDTSHAIEQFKAAWDVTLKTNLITVQLQGQMALATIEDLNGRPAGGLIHLQRMIKLCEIHNQNEHKLGILRLIKNIQLEQGDTQAALETYRQINEFINNTLLGEVETRLSILRAVNEVESAWTQVKFERERAERLQHQINLQREMEEQHLLAERHRMTAEHQREILKRKESIILRLSHEIRNPLTVISAANELIQRYHARMNPEQIVNHTTQIDEQVRRIATLLNEVLTAITLDQPPEL